MGRRTGAKSGRPSHKSPPGLGTFLGGTWDVEAGNRPGDFIAGRQSENARGRGTSRNRRRAVVGAAGIAIIAMFVVGTALPAWAHHPVLSGTTACSDGDHVISWTIGNSESGWVMHIDTATAVLGSQSFAVTGYSPNVAKLGSTSATSTLPGGSTGTVTLTVKATWTDGTTATRSGTVTLSSQCSGSTTTTIGGGTTTTIGGTTTTIGGGTTTTIGGQTTTTISGETTTTVGGETTTTISGETSTSVGGSTTTTTGTPVGPQGSTSPTSTPVGPQGSTAPTSDSGVTANTSPATGSLPFTGGSSTGPIFGLASLVAGGIALTVAHRKKQSRDS